MKKLWLQLESRLKKRQCDNQLKPPDILQDIFSRFLGLRCRKKLTRIRFIEEHQTQRQMWI